MQTLSFSETAVPIKVWASQYEDGAMKQAMDLAKLPFVKGWVALMPDTHQGYGMPIGGVIATDGIVIPNAVGVDIGCGMAALKTDLQGITTDELKAVMGEVRSLVPVGFYHHNEPQPWIGFSAAPDNPIIRRELDSARYQLGTLGGGNHFIEFQADEEGYLWVMIHSGSRNLGLKVAKHYHGFAKAMCQRWHVALPNEELAYLPVDEQGGKDYIEAMDFCLSFAQANRQAMLHRILDVLGQRHGAHYDTEVNIHHNYAIQEHHLGRNLWVHRKGATQARMGQQGIIPGSMGSASYIVEGLGNPQSFHSCSHGAGRKLGRKAAQKALDLVEEQAKMEGIVHSLRHENDLDEAPGAYKDIDQVMQDQVDLVKVLVKLRPLGSIKG